MIKKVLKKCEIICQKSNIVAIYSRGEKRAIFLKNFIMNK